MLQVLKLERLSSYNKLICEHCGKEIVKTYDCIGHYVIEFNDVNVNDYSISLNLNNIKLMHFKCHNEIYECFGCKRSKKIYIVYSSPCSDKST